MSILYDKYGKKEYKSLDEITSDIINEDKKEFVLEIPNSKINGLDLVFYITDHSNTYGKEMPSRKLKLRLLDGDSYYIHYGGWRTIKEFNDKEIKERFNHREIAEKIVSLYKNLREEKYLLELEKVKDSYYYRIKSLSVDGKDWIKEKLTINS